MKILPLCFLVAFYSLALEAFPEFENVADSAGLRFILTSGLPSKEYIPESMSGGVGFIDFDNDGWIDTYLVNGSTLEAERVGDNSAMNHLFRNNRDGTFTDVTEQAGVGDKKWGMGVCVGDVNNDGWDDLYITNFGPNLLYLNQGNGTFRDFSQESGTDDPSWSSSAAFADFDEDGDLDLYVSNYVYFDINRPPRHGMQLEHLDQPLECRYRGIKVQCGPRGLLAQSDRFFENRGNGTFIDKTRESGIEQPENYYGLGVVWGDYDNDGDLDVFVANDSTPNFLFQNNGNKTFTEVGLIAAVAFNEDGREQAGMGVDFSDFDNDGDLDLFVTNFSDDTNTLYRNEGNGRFTEATYAAGLGELSWQKLGWGASFADLDLDGWKDLVMVNGHVFPEVDLYQIGTSLRQPNFVFRNLKNGRFEEVSRMVGAGFSEVRNSRGLAVGDINNNGHIDLLISNLDESPSLLLNSARNPGNWILLKLKGTLSNRSAIGTRVYVQTGPLTQMQEVKSGGSYQSQNDLRLHFGLGPYKIVDQIRIRWPNGRIQKLNNVGVNQILTIEEKGLDNK
ncbi:CRTAC1 family protein [Acidobacteria bacterium AH-259-A15]|nr:CRTAC1 family protein [Acidobacteria bacterium AH-259-A15]